MSNVRRYEPYASYKDSGVEWLGEVPGHWEIHRIKNVADLRFSNVDKHSLEAERPVRLCNYTDVYYNEYIDGSIDFMKATASAVEIERFELRAGDVLLTKDSESPGDIAVPALIIESMEEVLCGYHLALLRPHQPRLWPRFLLRALQVGGVNDQFAIAANGITRFGLSQSAIADAIVPAPPLTEQRAIATFLNHQTARIDTLIARNERLLDLLDEKRTALITGAVTKGLDPEVPLKDSGVEWFGEVPGHWEVRRLKSLIADPVTDGPHETPEFLSDGVPFLSVDGIQNGELIFDACRRISHEAHLEYSRKCAPRRNDILMGKAASTGKIARVKVDFDFSVWSPLALIRPDRANIEPSFLEYALKSTVTQIQIDTLCTSNTQRNISMRDIPTLLLVVPPLSNQSTIAAHLDHQTAHLDTVRDKITTAITFLREYRTGLISAAVTGKIDVRGFTLPDSDRSDDTDHIDGTIIAPSLPSPTPEPST